MIKERALREPTRMNSWLRWTALAVTLALAAQGQAQLPRSSFIPVDTEVRLDVLDWGGSGRPLVLLAGNGQTAHSFDGFAESLAASYRVYGVTRRGFGASSRPATGYLSDRLADDVLAVIDSLRLSRPVLVGHSLAGQELSSIAERHPERVAGLVYLDAGYSYALYDTTRGDYRIDVAELERHLDELQEAGSRGAVRPMDSLFAALLGRDLPSVQRDLTLMRDALSQLTPGQPAGPPLSTGIARAIDEGQQRHRAPRIPVLAVFAVARPPAGVGTDSAATREWLQRDTGPVGRFARAVPQARVVVLPNANHFVFRSNAAEVIGAMRAFIDALPSPDRKAPRDLDPPYNDR